MKNSDEQVRGFSLTELLIALLIGALLTMGTVRIFVANRETYGLLAGMVQLQANASLAFDFIGRAVRSAGYSGCVSHTDFRAGIGGSLRDMHEFDIDTPVDGLEATTTGWTPDLSSLPGKSKLYANRGIKKRIHQPGTPVTASGLPVMGSDFLILRQLYAPSWHLAEAIVPGRDIIIRTESTLVGGHRNPGNFGFPSRKDAVLTITDCFKGTMFDAKVGKPVAGQVRLQGVDMATKDASYGSAALLAPVEASVFYVATGTGFNNRGAASLSLWRKLGVASPQELVTGIAGMQVRYGVDMNGDGIPDRYRSRAEITDLSAIRSIWVTLLATSHDAVHRHTDDGLLRQIFTRVFHVRND